MISSHHRCAFARRAGQQDNLWSWRNILGSQNFWVCWTLRQPQNSHNCIKCICSPSLIKNAQKIMKKLCRSFPERVCCFQVCYFQGESGNSQRAGNWNLCLPYTLDTIFSRSHRPIEILVFHCRSHFAWHRIDKKSYQHYFISSIFHGSFMGTKAFNNFNRFRNTYLSRISLG